MSDPPGRTPDPPSPPEPEDGFRLLPPERGEPAGTEPAGTEPDAGGDPELVVARTSAPPVPTDGSDAAGEEAALRHERASGAAEAEVVRPAAEPSAPAFQADEEISSGNARGPATGAEPPGAQLADAEPADAEPANVDAAEARDAQPPDPEVSVRPPEAPAAAAPLAVTRARHDARGRDSSSGAASGAARVLAVLAGVLVLGLLVDAFAAPAAPRSPEQLAQPAATSGAWYCPVAPDDGEPAVIAVASAGDAVASVVVVHYADGEIVADAPVELSPGAGLEVALDPDETRGPVAIRWRGGPVVATWRSLAGDGGAAPCPGEPSPTWYLAGLDTAEGSSSRVHLFNPYPVDASASVSFATPDGELPLVRTDTIYVPARGHTVLELNDFVPEEPELGATVRVRTGRVVVQGEVRNEPIADAGGPVGRTLVPAAARPADTWGFAFARSDEQSTSWLTVLNPSERDAAVSVQVSTPRPDGVVLPEVTIPAGGVRRVDLADTSELPEFAVTVTGLNDVPVVVTRTSDLNAGGRRGVATSLGAEPATTWELAGAGSDSRQARLSVSNPGPEPVTVDVTSGVADVPAWRGVQIPPNGRVGFELAEAGPDLASIPVRVQASGPIVPELRLLDAGEDLRFWTAVGVAAARWTGPSTRPPVERDPSLATAPLFSATEAPPDDPLRPPADEGSEPEPSDEPAESEEVSESPPASEPASEPPPASEPASQAETAPPVEPPPPVAPTEPAPG